MRITLLLMLACGTIFRFVALGDKLYTNDEATTSVHVSGHTIRDYLDAASAGRIRTMGDAMRFQSVDPHTTLKDVVTTLAVEDPQHPPLFYLLERSWQHVFGNSIVARRSLSAVIGVLVIAAAYGFGLALLRSRRGAAILCALVAVSPFHELYAQQAREYALWTLFVLLSSALLLRALEDEAPADWLLYALSAALGLYTDALFLYALASHAAFVVFAYRSNRASVLRFAAAAGVAVGAFAPWLVVLYRGRGMVTNNAYFSAPLPANLFALKWLFNIGAVFFDLDYLYHATAIVLVPLLALIAVAWFVLCRRAEPRVALFVCTLGGLSVLAFVVPDLLRHESRSTSGRYLIPAWIACEVTVAFLISQVARRRSARARATGAGVLASFGVLGLASSWVGMHHEYWWGDASVAALGDIAHAIERAERPVSVVFDDDHPAWDFAPVELANIVRPDVGLVLLAAGEPLPRTLARTARTVFALDPSRRFVERLAREGWHPELSYRFTTADPKLRALRTQAGAARAAAGVAGEPSSLWRLRR